MGEYYYETAKIAGKGKKAHWRAVIFLVHLFYFTRSTSDTRGALLIMAYMERLRPKGVNLPFSGFRFIKG